MTSADLYRLVGFGPLAVLKDAPAPDVGGTVFLMRHECYSLNLLVGDGGWQSEGVLFNREDAERAAAALADYCSAELDV